MRCLIENADNSELRAVSFRANSCELQLSAWSRICTMLRNAMLLGGQMLGSQILYAQTLPPTTVKTNVPVRELSAPDAKSTEHFGTILNVRPLANGGLLVNDGQRRQLVTLDAMLGHRVVLVDSISVGGQSYGATAAPLVPYLGDSSLFVDNASLSLLLIDPTGKIVRVMAAARPADLRYLGNSASGVDAKGNLVYRRTSTAGVYPIEKSKVTVGKATTIESAFPDSAAVVRGSFDTRSIDTVGMIRAETGDRGREVLTEPLRLNTIFRNPLNTPDEWCVLSDGSIAFVRGHDYHVDLLQPNGKWLIGNRLPFDWKALSDGDKRLLVDSTRAARARLDSISKARNAERGRPVTLESDGPVAQKYQLVWDVVPLKEIPDYWPPIRTGAARADLDAHLWILPTTSAQSKRGELIYDVVNNRGELVQRVQVPAGRSIAGFGHNGIVYLMTRDAEGWTLERTHVLGAAE